MRRRIALVLMGLIALAGLLSPVVASAATSAGPQAAHAQAKKSTKVFFGNVCTNDATAHCWQAQAFNDGDGQAVKYYNRQAGANLEWNVWQLGEVTANYPFTSGTAAYNQGLPGYYAGRPTYQFAYAPNGAGSDQCAANDYASNGDVQVSFEPCNNDDPSEEWIYSSYGYFVNVFATEVSYSVQENAKECAGTTAFGPGNNDRVMITSTMTKQMTFYNPLTS